MGRRRDAPFDVWRGALGRAPLFAAWVLRSPPACSRELACLQWAYASDVRLASSPLWGRAGRGPSARGDLVVRGCAFVDHSYVAILRSGSRKRHGRTMGKAHPCTTASPPRAGPSPQRNEVARASRAIRGEERSMVPPKGEARVRRSEEGGRSTHRTSPPTTGTALPGDPHESERVVSARVQRERAPCGALPARPCLAAQPFHCPSAARPFSRARAATVFCASA